MRELLKEVKSIHDLQVLYRNTLKDYIIFRSSIVITFTVGIGLSLAWTSCKVFDQSYLRFYICAISLQCLLYIFEKVDLDAQKLGKLVYSIIAGFIASDQIMGMQSGSLYLCKEPVIIQSLSGWILVISFYVGGYYWAFYRTKEKE